MKRLTMAHEKADILINMLPCGFAFLLVCSAGVIRRETEGESAPEASLGLLQLSLTQSWQLSPLGRDSA